MHKMMHFIVSIGVPFIMGIWEGHQAPMNHARKFAICVENVLSAMDKTLKLTFYSCEKNLVQYGDGHGFIATFILLLSVS